jgi:phenylalanyl-tRNA synthetase beta chain
MSSEGDDTVLELDISSNRGDCLSLVGVAREAAAIFRTSLRWPETDPPQALRPDPDPVRVSIETPHLCGRYTARVISGVQVAASPPWVARRLEASGIRPVNNIADITNYVLLELGHPLHAFDLDRIGSREILVRTAVEGETLETLDGIVRRLEPGMLAITNGQTPIALAGVMGGRASEISGQTRNILIESAWFDPRAVRRAARSLNLSTEASYRFERGTDPEMAARASERASRLILQLAGGQASGERVDVYPGRSRPRIHIELRRARIAGQLGSAIPDPEARAILERLGCVLEDLPSGWRVQVPGHRNDIHREEDLLEELARHWGYDRFPSTLPPWSGGGRGLPWQAAERTVRSTLQGLGYSETCTLAFSNRETETEFSPADEPVALRNPLSEDEPILRTSLVGSMLGTLRWNLNRGIRDLKLYEIAKVYPTRGEYRQLVLAQTGALWGRNVHNAGVESGFYTLKGDVERLIGRFQVASGARDADIPGYYHPGRSVRLGDLALLGELGEDLTRRFRIRQRVYLAEIRIEPLYAALAGDVAVKPIPKYPRIRRDFSLLVESEVRFFDVATAVRSAGIPELISVLPFDRLDEGTFPRSCYSLAIALEYQSPDRTLTDAEVEEFDQRVLARLQAIGVRMRTG